MSYVDRKEVTNKGHIVIYLSFCSGSLYLPNSV